MKLPIKYSNLDYNTKKQVRLAYLEQQKGLCYFCKKSLSNDVLESFKNKYPIHWEFFPKNFLNYPIHLHHNHNTDLTIGVVHSYCNAVLWQYYKE